MTPIEHLCLHPKKTPYAYKQTLIVRSWQNWVDIVTRPKQHVWTVDARWPSSIRGWRRRWRLVHIDFGDVGLRLWPQVHTGQLFLHNARMSAFKNNKTFVSKSKHKSIDVIIHQFIWVRGQIATCPPCKSSDSCWANTRIFLTNLHSFKVLWSMI